MLQEGGTIEWVHSGSFGSHVSYLYPMSILKADVGERSSCEFTGITFACADKMSRNGEIYE